MPFEEDRQIERWGGAVWEMSSSFLCSSKELGLGITGGKTNVSGVRWT